MDDPPPVTVARPQFGLRAMMWTMLVIAMALAYLRHCDSDTVFAEGAVVVLFALALGAAIGLIAGRWRDSVYWSVVVATAAFLSVAADSTQGQTFRAAWSTTGVVIGSFCGVVPAKRLGVRMFVGMSVAGLTMFAFSGFLDSGSLEVRLDLFCAPIIGALVAILIEIILWTERNQGLPRYMTASWLLLAVVIGNMAVPIVIA